MKWEITDPGLLRECAFVDGIWVSRDAASSYAVRNPATGEQLALVPDLGEAEAVEAIEAAHRAFPAWRALAAGVRAALLRKWFDLMIAHQEDLADRKSVV